MAATVHIHAARLVLAGWAAALFLPVAFVAGKVMRGYEVGAWGWMGTFDLQFGWWANLALLVSLRLSSDRRPPPLGRARAITILLLALAFDATTWRYVPNDYRTLPIDAYGAGYYLWFATIAAGIGLLWWRYRAEQRIGSIQ
ncbi:MAG: hypothetical protein H7268_15970 [Sandarakinorhabdus sp.]|nr:hypothetical protein [Sandarakinorhabdus sp.]